MSYQWTENVDRVTGEHLLIKTRCLVIKLWETTKKMPWWTFIRVRINVVAIFKWPQSWLLSLHSFCFCSKRVHYQLLFFHLFHFVPVSSKMYRYIKCRLRTRSNNNIIKFAQKMRKKMAFYTVNTKPGQVYLMQTEVPSMIALSEENYQLIYSESYTGNLHHCNSIIEGYQYSMSRDRAFESLLSQNYSSFILTIECIGVSIYHTDNGS